MVEHPLISIIVPVYNVQQYLDKCVYSLINQTYSNIEIILVDDGSTDSSGYQCDRFASMDKRIRVIHQVNGGLSCARNKGLTVAKGQYIGFVDSDDWVDEEMYEELLYACSTTSSEIAVCGYRKIFPNHTEVQCIKKTTLYNNVESINMMVKNGPDKIGISAWCKLYFRDTISELKFPEGRKYEDIIFATLALYKSHQVVYINKPYYNYVKVREGSITNEDFNESKLIDELPQYWDRIQFFKENHLQVAFDTALSSYIEMCFKYYIQTSNSNIQDKKKYLYEIKYKLRNIVKENKLNFSQVIRIKIFMYYPQTLSIINRLNYRKLKKVFLRIIGKGLRG